MDDSFYCPICGKTENAMGYPFSSKWAVALHVASASQAGERLHTSWIVENSGLSKQDIKARTNNDVARTIRHSLWETLIRDGNSRAKHQEESAPVTVFEIIHEIERNLHRHIKYRLEQEYADAWWKEGVPLGIRKECVARREESDDGGDPYVYTLYVDLLEILDKRWSLFETDFTRLRASYATKPTFLSELKKSNAVRNRHAHPPRSPQPGTQEFAEDLAFVSKLADSIAIFTAESTQAA